MDSYPERNYEGELVFETYDEAAKEQYGFRRPLWWDYFDPEGPSSDERLDSRYSYSGHGSPKNRAHKTTRICIYNQFTDYTGPLALAETISYRLEGADIHHRIIGYEFDNFILNLFLGSTKKDVVDVTRKFMTANKVRMDEDWEKNNVSIGRLYYA